MDTTTSATDVGMRYLGVCTSSMESWKHSPTGVRFIMSYVSDILAHRIGQLNKWGVHARWVGRCPRLQKSMIDALEKVEAHAHINTILDLVMCMNYGGCAEIVDTVRKIGHEIAVERLRSERITGKSFGHRLYLPDVPDVDLMICTSGEKRISSYLFWQLTYLEMMFIDTP